MTDRSRSQSTFPASPRTRGVTTVLRYALFLVIVTLLVAGLFVGVSGFVESQQERAIGSQLETVGNRLAADLTTANYVVSGSGAATTTRFRTTLPDAVASSEYRVSITGSGPRYELTLRSVEPAVERTVAFRSSVPVAATTVTGGRVTIRYNGSSLVVSDD